MGASCSIINDPVITYPVELVVNILSNLTASDLVSCRRVNHHFKGIIDSSQELQYHIDTAVAGVVDNPNSPLSLLERKDALARRQHAWDTLQPQRTTSDIVIKYPLNVGMEAKRPELVETRLHISPLREEGHYRIVQLAACPDNTDLVAVGMRCGDPASLSRRCSSHSFQVDILYFSGAGGEHPWTRKSTVHVKDVLEKYGVTWEMNIGIHTDILAVHLRPTTILGGDQWPERELWVFDWKTGEEIACLKGKGIEAFRFLSNSVMVLVNITPSESTATLELFSISVTNGNLRPTSMMRIATLQLPFVDNGCRIARVDFYPPFRVKNPVVHEGRLLYDTSIDAKPFTSAQSDNIIFVDINIGSRRGHDNLSFFVHPSTLLRHIPGPPSRSQGNMWDPIPWEVWGPTATRWFEGGGPITCGHHSLLKQRYPGGWEIWDFNPYRVRRLGKGFAVENETARLTVETEPSCARSDGIEKGIRSSLPFVKVVPKKWDYTYAGLYEDIVIGEKHSVGTGQYLVEKLYFG
ncbi:hypothetical protein JOM56_010854 [Amanita muscaria]